MVRKEHRLGKVHVMGTVETSERSFRHGAAAILATWPGEGYARVLILVQVIHYKTIVKSPIVT